MSPGSSWEWDRFVSWLNEQRSVQPRQEMTRDSKGVPMELLKARGREVIPLKDDGR